MNYSNWVECIGLWGSGKSTLINKLQIDLIKNNIESGTTEDYFKLNKFLRIYLTFIDVLRSLKTTILIIYILFPKLIYSLIKNDIILLSELRSFFYCYRARVSSLFSLKNNNLIWEGEFHLIPFLGLKYKKQEKLVDLILNLTKFRSLSFIVLDTPLDMALENIINDIKLGKKIRFNLNEINLFKDYQKKTIENQNKLLDILKKRGENLHFLKYENYDYEKLLSKLLYDFKN